MTSLFQILMLLLDVATFFIFAHFIMSWLISFSVLNIRQPLVSQIWYGLQRILEPLYGPLRRVLPQTGGLDFAPLVALLLIYALRIILTNNAGAFI
ncbi:MAG: YggT family protein [Pseudomonadota bacterium]